MALWAHLGIDLGLVLVALWANILKARQWLGEVIWERIWKLVLWRSGQLFWWLCGVILERAWLLILIARGQLVWRLGSGFVRPSLSGFGNTFWWYSGDLLHAGQGFCRVILERILELIGQAF